MFKKTYFNDIAYIFILLYFTCIFTNSTCQYILLIKSYYLHSGIPFLLLLLVALLIPVSSRLKTTSYAVQRKVISIGTENDQKWTLLIT